MSNYPISIDTQLAILDKNTPINPNAYNALRSALIAVESELGIKPSSTLGTVRARLDYIDNRINLLDPSIGGDAISINGIPVVTTSLIDGYSLIYDSSTSTIRLELPISSDMLHKVCTLEQFGAVGDGTTDDSAAMTAALAAIGAGTFGALILGAKTYNLGAVGFTIPSNCLIRGQGWNSILKTTLNGTLLQIVDGATSVHLEDFKLLGNATGASQRGIQSGSGASLGAAVRGVINGVMVESFAQFGILIWNGNAEGPRMGFSISNCFVKNCTTYGYALYAEYATMSNCAATTCGSGLVITAGNQRVIGCDFSGNTDGIYITAGGNDAHSSIVGCTVNHNTNNAFNFGVILNALEIVGCHVYQGKIVTSGANSMITFNGCEIAPTYITNAGGRLRFVNCIGIDDYLVGGDAAITETGNGWTEFVNCRSKDDTLSTWISSRTQQNFSFSSDANQTLTAQQSVAEILIIASGTITASRQLTNYFAPSTKRRQRVLNNTSFIITYKWSSGTSVSIAAGGWADISSDGTNAIIFTTSPTLKTISGGYSVSSADNTIILTSNASPTTINLLSSPITGNQFTIKDGVGNAATNNITVSGNGKNIDGSATYVINSNYASAIFIYNGTEYSVI